MNTTITAATTRATMMVANQKKNSTNTSCKLKRIFREEKDKDKSYSPVSNELKQQQQQPIYKWHLTAEIYMYERKLVHNLYIFK